MMRRLAAAILLAGFVLPIALGTATAAEKGDRSQVAPSTRSPLPWQCPPTGSVLLEGEAFAKKSGWVAAAHREDAAPGGLSGGAALFGNKPDARAVHTLTLPPGTYTVWVRSYDKADGIRRYQYTLEVDGNAHRMADVEPQSGKLVWERLAPVEGGKHTLVLHSPHTHNSQLDCILFVPDPQFDPRDEDTFRVVTFEPTPEVRPGDPCPWRKLVIEPLAPPRGDQSLCVGISRRGLIAWAKPIPLPSLPTTWKAGQRIEIPPTAIPMLRWYSCGEYELLLGLSQGRFETKDGKPFFPPTIRLSNPTGRGPAFSVRRHNDEPTLCLGEKPVFGFMYLPLGAGVASRYEDFRQIGVTLYSVGHAIGNQVEGEFDSMVADKRFAEFFARDPNAYFLPRVGLEPPRWWAEKNPDELILTSDGKHASDLRKSRVGVSMASEKWRRDIGKHLERYVRHLANLI